MGGCKPPISPGMPFHQRAQRKGAVGLLCAHGRLFWRRRPGVQIAATIARLASGLSGGRGSPIPTLKLTSMMVTTATGTPFYIAGW